MSNVTLKFHQTPSWPFLARIIWVWFIRVSLQTRLSLYCRVSWIWHRLVFLLPIGDVFHPPLPSLSAAAALLPLAQRVEKVTQQQTKMREVTQLPDSAIQRRKKRSQDCSRICSESSGCCWRKHTRDVCPERATCGELTKQQHMEHVQLWRRM